MTEDGSMRVKRTAFVAGAVAALVVAGSVAAGNGDRKVLDATLAGIPASLAGQSFMGANGGGLPWRLDAGTAKLWSDGRLVVEVEGLVFAAGPNEGRNTVPTGQALVSCGGAVVAMSDPVAFSPAGDAEVQARVALPSSCLAPVVFFAGVTANGPRWFAVTGF
jgi:hypothetical protein